MHLQQSCMGGFNLNFSFLPDYWPYFQNGIIYTVLLSLFTVVIAILPAVGLALMRLSKNKVLNFIASAYIEIIRGTPMLVQLLIVYYGVFTYIVIPDFYVFGFINIAHFIPAVLAVCINSSAYVSEIIRAGILAVDKGQTEAARSLGMPQNLCMRKIVLPQAVKNILPALGNEFVTIIKESSICSTLGMQELMWGANAVRGASFIPLEPLLLAAALYFCMTFPASKLISYLERRMARGDAK